ncbi:MAG: hypothetical protein GX660_08855 [Clostridiaceae bacterium]|nr:hypothetical protein [Clostridiaceae bacterium]
MQTKNNKKIETIAKEFDKVNNFSKSLIKHGTQVSLLLLVLGTLIVLLNQTVLSYDDYVTFVGTSIIKNSFIILAEVIIGGLLIDYMTKK